MRKVLVIAHGHPELNKGGGEQAAYQFFQQCLAQGDDAYFLGRTDALPHGGAAFSSLDDEGREILFHTTQDDFFLMSNIKTRHLWTDFKDLLTLINPEVIYLHHYFFLGIELLTIAKKTLPNTPIIMTLHEYYGICAKGGLMLKNPQQLCYQSSPQACHRCMPEKSPGDFFLRKQYIANHLSLVDHFISPSQFLKDRYVDWGIAEQKITVLENGQPDVKPLPLKAADDKVRLTYMGQINPYKGLDVLLQALLLLSDEEREQIQLEIHGSGFNQQSSDYQKQVKKHVKQLGDCVQLHGRYDLHQLPAILQDSDWVVVPSIWWENSPMVIQEALNYGRPLIVSDIGGMAEKVQDQVTGLHFSAGKPYSLAKVLKQVIANPSLSSSLAGNIQKPLTVEQTYQTLLSMTAVNDENSSSDDCQ